MDNHTLGVFICISAGFLHAVEAIVMKKAHHLDNMTFTHYYTFVCCIASVPASNFEQWTTVTYSEWIIIFFLGLSGTGA